MSHIVYYIYIFYYSLKQANTRVIASYIISLSFFPIFMIFQLFMMF